MQNKTLSFLGALCLSVTFLVSPALSASQKEAQPKKEATEQTQKVEKTQKAGDKPSISAVDQRAKQLLEKELSEAPTDDKTLVDFPNRPGLGSLEMAPLPGVKESLITGPASMEPSVSKTDLPNEQLLGRITTEVFQEMADLERGNVFLKLQMQKEQLKNDLEKLKATYRQARLEEIAKREDVVRSRIQWWQEQEKIRLEMEKKKAETEAIEQQIAEAEELRNKLRADAINKQKATANKQDKSERNDKNQEEVIVQIPPFSKSYELMIIKGTRGHLTAGLKDLSDNTILAVQAGEVLPTGHAVIKITTDQIVVKHADVGAEERLILSKKKTIKKDQSQENLPTETPKK